MSTSRQLLDFLEKGIRLWVEDGQLRFQVPRGIFTPELHAQLMANQAALVAFLGEHKQYALPSFAQERMWLLEQLNPGSTAIIGLIFRITGELDLPALTRSLDEIARRHEPLRTMFTIIEGVPVQLITPPTHLPLPINDLRSLPAPVRAAEARQLAEAQKHREFDLAQCPLIRTSLVQLEDNEYYLLINIHHIVADGWSTGVLIQELSVLYQAFSKGAESPLPELDFKYGDWASRQRERLQGETLQTHLAYWQQQLATPAHLELATDRPRRPVQVPHSNRIAFNFSKQLSADLKVLTLQERGTLFMALLAGFAALLYRYTGAETINVGTFIANRTEAEAERLIGLFTNLLVLRTDLNGNPTFRELFRRVRDRVLDAYTYQDLPFAKLMETLPLAGNGNLSLPFNVILILQNIPVSKTELPGLTIERLAVTGEGEYPNSDITLFVSDAGEALTGTVEYNADLFEAASVRRILQHLQNLFEAAIATPDQPIEALPLMSDEERYDLLMDLNDAPPAPLVRETIQELFQAQAAQTPETIAVVLESSMLTYAELNVRANQLAHYLRAQGIGPEAVVGVAMARSLDAIIALLGVLKAGGAYIVLDTSYPVERLQFMIADAQVQVLLAQEQYLPKLAILNLPTVVVDGDARAVLAQQLTENPVNLTAPDNLAYIIYTSGSTGIPKGVMISQRALAQYVMAASRQFGINSADRVLQFASLSFDTAGEEIYPTLLKGGTLVLRTEAMLDSSAAFLQACVTQGITILDLPTAYWHLFAAELETGSLSLPAALGLVIIGGEKAQPERVETWLKYAPASIRLLNTYGPTEATIVATMYDLITERAAEAAPRAPIGKPIANKRVYVLDHKLQPVPIGVPGELYVGGNSLARGYQNHPEQTAAAFLPDAFSQVPGSRLYRTGDLVRILPNQNLEFLRRVDDQVKLRGFRVELGEIEVALRQYPEVRDAVVVAREVEPGEKQLVAYIVPDAGAEIKPDMLESRLREKMPSYMIPSVWVQLKELPLTASGKVNRRALPAPTTSAKSENFVAPETALEKKLAEIWEQVLQVDQVGIYDDFFKLGGHSLNATQLMQRVNSTFHTNIPLLSFWQQPNIYGLALLIEEFLLDELEREESGEESLSQVESSEHA